MSKVTVQQLQQGVKITPIPFGPERERVPVPAPVDVTQKAYNNWDAFNVTVGTAVIPLLSGGSISADRVILTADIGNGGIIYAARNSPSATKGIRLAANQSQVIHINDLGKIMVSASAAGQTLIVTYYNNNKELGA